MGKVIVQEVLEVRLCGVDRLVGLFMIVKQSQREHDCKVREANCEA